MPRIACRKVCLAMPTLCNDTHSEARRELGVLPIAQWDERLVEATLRFNDSGNWRAG